jgi:hypothetical protein
MNLGEHAGASNTEGSKVVQRVDDDELRISQPRVADGAGGDPGTSASEPLASVGCCDPVMNVCARAMGGDDPGTAYAAAILWFQGYPDPPHPGV